MGERRVQTEVTARATARHAKVSNSASAPCLAYSAEDPAPLAVRDPVQDDAIDSGEGTRSLWDGLVPLSDRLHHCWRSRLSGSGRYDFCGLADGFLVTFGDMEVGTLQLVHMSFPDT